MLVERERQTSYCYNTFDFTTDIAHTLRAHYHEMAEASTARNEHAPIDIVKVCSVHLPCLSPPSAVSHPRVKDMKALRLIVTAIVIVICCTPNYARAQSACNGPQTGLDSWQVATPESVGLSSSVLCSMVKWLNDSKNVDVHAVVIARHGKLAFEHYFTGHDEHLGHSVGKVTFNAQTRHDEGRHPDAEFGASRRWFSSTEDLFHPFALDLTDGITRMASGAAIDGAVNFAGDVRTDLMRAQLPHQFLLIVTLIGAQCDAMPAGDLCRHREGRLGFYSAADLSQPGIDHQAVAIVHLHMPGIRENHMGDPARNVAAARRSLCS
jgi:hypothetical protein